MAQLRSEDTCHKEAKCASKRHQLRRFIKYIYCFLGQRRRRNTTLNELRSTASSWKAGPSLHMIGHTATEADHIMGVSKMIGDKPFGFRRSIEKPASVRRKRPFCVSGPDQQAFGQRSLQLLRKVPRSAHPHLDFVRLGQDHRHGLVVHRFHRLTGLSFQEGE